MARKFNGTTDFASVALDLSSTNVVSVSTWLWWDAYVEDDDLAFEFTPVSYGTTLGFMLDPNWSGAGSVLAFLQGNVGQQAAHGARPSAGTWHHYACIFDKSLSGASVLETSMYIDGANPPGYTRFSAGTDNTNNFGNSTFYVMTRGGTSLFGAGRMASLAIYTSALTVANVATLAAGGDPRGVGTSLLDMWKMTAPGTTEASLTGSGHSLSYTGTTLEADPPALFRKAPIIRPQAASRAAVI